MSVDSNFTSLAIAEEESLGVLPASPIFYKQAPNSYPDFGGEISTVARDTINSSRQIQKGTTTDLDATGGFSSDLTMNNMIRLLQGFFYADARETEKTEPLNGTKIAITSIASGSNTINATGIDIFAIGDIVKAENFSNENNNGIFTVATSSASAITVNESLADEPAPPSSAKITKVGIKFPTDDLDIDVTGSVITITSASKNFSTLGFEPGNWIFIGGDVAASKFSSFDEGFARIASVSGNFFTIEEYTFTPVTDSGTGKDIEIYISTFLKNENNPSLIKRRTYQLERTLGEDSNGTQSEYIIGCGANEFKLNIPQADKVTCDLSFIGTTNELRNGLEGLKSGTRVEALSEEALNTSSDIYRNKLSVFNQNEELFAFLTDLSITINNNISTNKAIGTLGAFDFSTGNFSVTGSLTAYFTTIEAVRAVRNNADVGFNTIISTSNEGIVFDIPLLGLGGGKVTVEKNEKVKIPLEKNAAENKFGFTMSASFFDYLPDIADANNN